MRNKILVLGLMFAFLLSPVLSQETEKTTMTEVISFKIFGNIFLDFAKAAQTFFELRLTKILNEGDVVHMNLGEEIFHIEGCLLLGKESRRNMSLGYAYEKGYQPCEKCILSKEAMVKSTFIEVKFLGRVLYPHGSKEEYLKTHPDLPVRIVNAILNGDVLIGMTSQQVIASRGTPHEINRTTGEWGVHEQWVMHSDEIALDSQDKEYGYIYFENGIVTGWQSK